MISWRDVEAHSLAQPMKCLQTLLIKSAEM